MPKIETAKQKIQYRIKRSKDTVFIPKDFKDIASYSQVFRGLQELIKENLLVKVGQGLYAKARPSFIDGEIVPDDDLRPIAQTALRKLGVKVCLTPEEKAYNEYRSTQVPNGYIIGVKKKNITRKIGFDGLNIRYEYVPDNVNDALYSDNEEPPFVFENNS